MTGRRRPVGRRSRLVELSDRDAVHHLWAAWVARRDPDVEELVAGALSILVTVREGADPDRVLDRLAGTLATAAPVAPVEVDIPVEYAGEDLDEVGRLTGLGPEEVVRRHSAAAWTVSFLGFSPGFAYLAGGDAVLEVPRLDRPRTSVPAGSVALAAGWSAVYPQSTPGGWRLIGRTEAVMFDPDRNRPALLAPGDRVRFRPVRSRVAAAAPAATAPAPALRPPAPTSGAYLRVIDPGPLLTVQDLGRVGWAHLGAPRAGAADRASARTANELVGNQPGAAVLEATAAGPHLLIGSARAVAVTGGRAQVTVDGIPARQHVPLAVPAGAVVAVGAVEPGLRVYVAVAGGIGVEPVLGSRSTDTLSGLGPPPLRRGDVLVLGPVPASGPAVTQVGPGLPAGPGTGPLVVQAHIGPRHDRIGPEGMAVLATSEFVVDPASDRTGVRLGGPPVPVAEPGEIPSEPMVAGAVQIPHGGHPIVLLRNHPTTGGYPVAAVVDDEGVDRLAQARPGERVRFELVGP